MARLPRRGVRGFAGRRCRLFQEKEPALPVPWASAPSPQAHPLVCSARVRRQLVALEKTGRSFTAASWKELEVRCSITAVVCRSLVCRASRWTCGNKIPAAELGVGRAVRPAEESPPRFPSWLFYPPIARWRTWDFSACELLLVLPFPCRE